MAAARKTLWTLIAEWAHIVVDCGWSWCSCQTVPLARVSHVKGNAR